MAGPGSWRGVWEVIDRSRLQLQFVNNFVLIFSLDPAKSASEEEV